MQLFERARLYGEAVRLLDEFLGEDVRDRIMERFSHIAAPMQQRKMKDPWDVIARSALDVGVQKEAVQALQLLYLMRTNRWEAMPKWAQAPNPLVRQYLSDWQVLSEFETKWRRAGL